MVVTIVGDTQHETGLQLCRVIMPASVCVYKDGFKTEQQRKYSLITNLAHETSTKLLDYVFIRNVLLLNVQLSLV